MKKIKIIADDKIPFLKGVLDDRANVVYLPGGSIGPADIRDADALLVRTRTVCDESLLKYSSVKFIATATIGFDHIDTVYCEKNGIYWTNAPGCNSSSVEQYVVSALLTLALRFNLRLKEMTLAVIGVGNVGSKVARAARALGMRVLLNDPPRALAEGLDGFDSLAKIKEEADIISFHVPLNFDGPYRTWEMADREFFQGLAKKPILINSSRGEVILEKDLMHALSVSQIRALVIDVWNNEPGIDLKVLQKAYIATPHIAGYSTDGKANGTAMSVQALSRYFGLGMNEWRPSLIPSPENKNISVDCTGKSETEILHEVYSQCYDITIDDKALRTDPLKFEHLRGSYRLRREPSAFTVKLLNNSWPGLEQIFEKLGFTVLAPNCFCEI
jgi:erythronate-4-phosphate dehydrogenase